MRSRRTSLTGRTAASPLKPTFSAYDSQLNDNTSLKGPEGTEGKETSFKEYSHTLHSSSSAGKERDIWNFTRFKRFGFMSSLFLSGLWAKLNFREVLEPISTDLLLSWLLCFRNLSVSFHLFLHSHFHTASGGCFKEARHCFAVLSCALDWWWKRWRPALPVHQNWTTLTWQKLMTWNHPRSLYTWSLQSRTNVKLKVFSREMLLFFWL